MAEILLSLKESIGSGQELLRVTRFGPGVIEAMWRSEKVVPMSNFGGSLRIK